MRGVQCYELFGGIALKNHAILHRNIRNQNDPVILQYDLITISLWAERWQMELSINKCSVLSITLKRNSIFHDYDILGATLKRVTNHDYHGIAISSDLNWLRHAKKFITRQTEPLDYLKEPYPPAH